MPAFDPQKMADLVAEESRVANGLQATSIALNEQHADIKAKSPDDAANARYMIDQQKHGQLSRELGSIRAQRDAYGLREPTKALARKDAPLARWLRKGENGLEASERELFLGEIRGRGYSGRRRADLRCARRSRFGCRVGAGSRARGNPAADHRQARLLWRRVANGSAVHDRDGRRVPPDAGSRRWSGRRNPLGAGYRRGVLDPPNIGVQTFGAKTASSKSIVIAREAVQDVNFDIAGYSERQALRRMGRIWNKVFTTTASGVIGVVSSATAGLTTAVNTGFTWVEIVNLVYTINRAYREGARWARVDSTPRWAA